MVAGPVLLAQIVEEIALLRQPVSPHGSGSRTSSPAPASGATFSSACPAVRPDDLLIGSLPPLVRGDTLR